MYGHASDHLTIKPQDFALAAVAGGFLKCSGVRPRLLHFEGRVQMLRCNRTKQKE